MTTTKRDPSAPGEFRAILPEVGPIRIEHDGEDVDVVATSKGVRPGLIAYAESDEWEPWVYEAALAAAGWRQCWQWERPRDADYLVCEVVPQEDGE